jgi:uncharacterized RDD family membrane protein YckC
MTIALLLTGVVVGLLLITSNLDRQDPPDWALYLSLLTFIAWLPLWFVATSLLWFLRGASIGMLCMGLCVVGANGALPGLTRSAARAAMLAVLTAPALATPLVAAAALTVKIDGPVYLTAPAVTLLGLSVAACASVVFRRDRRAWHDLICGTQVVRADPRGG